MNRRIVSGIAIAVLSAAAFGSGGAFVPPLLETGWSAGAASLFRTTGASVLLAVPAFLALRGRWSEVRRQGWRVAAYGGLAIAGTQFAYYQALGRIPVGTALMIEYLAPVILVAATALMRRQLPPAGVLIGAGLAIAGLALVLDLFGAGADALSGDLAGYLFALAAAVLCAAYFALSAAIELPPVGLAGLGMIGASLSTGFFAALGLVPLTWSDALVTMGGGRVSPLVPLAFVTIVATVVAYLTGIAAARILGARNASFVALGEVLAAIVAAAVLLGQLPGLMQLVGAIVLLSGIALVLKYGEKSTPEVVLPPETSDERRAEVAVAPLA